MNPKILLATAIQAAKESGKIQKKGWGKKHTIRFKDDINLVTEVDKACEATIIKIISKKFPSHDFLAEESGEILAAREDQIYSVRARGVWGDGARVRQRRMGQRSPHSYRWIIDPLDGTTNYAHSFPAFCTSIGLEHFRKMILGVVYDPIRDELFTAIHGQGAYLNGKKIHVSRVPILKRSMLATGFAYNVQKVFNNNLNHFTHFIMQTQAVRRMGAAAVDLCYVACGRFDGFWEMELWPWDVAAASLILEEAGGRVSLFDGSPFDIYGKQIIASNGKIHKDMVCVIQEGI